MELSATRIITDDVAALVAFYERITGLPARWANERFAEISTASSTLAIMSSTVVPLMGEDAVEASANRSIILDFLVDDVDALYPALRDGIQTFVNEPTTMPWGNRSLLFRDPDGNLINFFTPTTPEAQARFARP